jgi:hypothetical protein
MCVDVFHDDVCVVQGHCLDEVVLLFVNRDV